MMFWGYKLLAYMVHTVFFCELWLVGSAGRRTDQSDQSSRFLFFAYRVARTFDGLGLLEDVLYSSYEKRGDVVIYVRSYSLAQYAVRGIGEKYTLSCVLLDGGASHRVVHYCIFVLANEFWFLFS